MRLTLLYVTIFLSNFALGAISGDIQIASVGASQWKSPSCPNIYFPETQCNIYPCDFATACNQPSTFITSTDGGCCYCTSSGPVLCSPFVPTTPVQTYATPLVAENYTSRVFDPSTATFEIVIPDSVVAGSLLRFATGTSGSTKNEVIFAQLGSPGSISNAQFMQTLGSDLYIPVLDGQYRNATLYVGIGCYQTQSCSFTYHIQMKIIDVSVMEPNVPKYFAAYMMTSRYLPFMMTITNTTKGIASLVPPYYTVALPYITVDGSVVPSFSTNINSGIVDCSQYGFSRRCFSAIVTSPGTIRWLYATTGSFISGNYTLTYTEAQPLQMSQWEYLIGLPGGNLFYTMQDASLNDGVILTLKNGLDTASNLQLLSSSLWASAFDESNQMVSFQAEYGDGEYQIGVVGASMVWATIYAPSGSFLKFSFSYYAGAFPNIMFACICASVGFILVVTVGSMVVRMRRRNRLRRLEINRPFIDDGVRQPRQRLATIPTTLYRINESLFRTEPKKETDPGKKETRSTVTTENINCVVCWEAPRDTVLAECWHAVLCKSCAQSLWNDPRSVCPVCRESVGAVLTIESLDGDVAKVSPMLQ